MDGRVLFIGGDKRMQYAAQAVSQNYEVSTLGLFSEEKAPLGRYGAVVLPLPFSRDGENINAPLSNTALPLSLVRDCAEKGAAVLCGMASPKLISLCEEESLRLYDYFTDEALTLKNAFLTAEAAAALLIQNTERSLCGAEVLITGGGRIAMLLAGLLRGFGADVTVCARSSLQRTRAELSFHRTADISELPRLCGSADIIVNTPPARLFTEQDFAEMKKDAVYTELASLPSEPYESYAMRQGIRYIHAAGLPGKFSPRTAGEAIAQAVIRRLSE